MKDIIKIEVKQETNVQNKKNKGPKLVGARDNEDIQKALAGYYVQLNDNVFENLSEVDKISLKSDINKIYTKLK